MYPKRPSSKEVPQPSDRSNIDPSLQRQVAPTSTGATFHLDLLAIKDALQAGQYNVVIALSSQAIFYQTLDADQFIELRANAFERQAKTALELHDALLLTQVRPSNARGYLRAAKLYSLQGRQEKAIEVLRKGYSLVNEQHTLLQQQIVIIEARRRRRIDFIIQSPYDILCSILSYIDTETLFNCANICRAWRSKLLQCPVPWRVIKVSNNRRWQNPGLLGDFMPIVSRYIEKVTIKCKGKLIAEYLGFLAVYNFPRLRFLYIFDDSMEGMDISSTLYTVLPHVASTLTELQIGMRFTLTISLKRILSICSNLKAINFFVRQIVQGHESFSISHNTMLTSVTLLAQEGIYNVSSFEALFSCSPHLRFFSLHYCEADIISIIGDHCPNLKAIRTSLVNLDDVPQYYKNTSSEMNTEGLELLVLGGIRSARPLSARLKASRKTLKYICLAPIGGSRSTFTDWEPLTWYVMTNVKYFYIWMERCSRAFRELLPAMLRCYPGLKTLRLESWYNLVSEESTPGPILSHIYQTVKEMKSLERLGLVRIDTCSDSFMELMVHFSTRYDHLKILEIRSCAGLSSALLLQIAKISSLEDLCIGLLPSHGICTSILTQFTQLLIQLPRLTNLILEDLELTTEAARNLARCKSLSRLWMHDVSIPFEGVALLVENIPDFHRFSSDE